jgi:hypothetical protein
MEKETILESPDLRVCKFGSRQLGELRDHFFPFSVLLREDAL